MPIPNRGNIYVPATTQEVLNQLLADYQSLLIEAGVNSPAIQPGTEPFIRHTSTANAVGGLYYNVAISADAQSELTATGTDLDNIRIAIGLPIVAAAPASGNVTASIVGKFAVTYIAGTQFTTKSGLRGQVFSTTTISPSPGAVSNTISTGSISAIMIDTGTASNVAAGDILTWVSPPINSLATALADPIDGLTGGVDDETDDQKRQRILNRRENLPAGGNWGFVADIAQGVSAGIQAAFVYPALGGPGSLKVALCKALQLTAPTSFTRELAGNAILGPVRDALAANMPEGSKIVVQSVADQPVDVALQISIPAFLSQGGNGWDDPVPFPTLVDADNGRVTVTVKTDTQHITVSALGNAPLIPSTVIWWSSTFKVFVTASVTSVSGSAGAYALTLDKPLSYTDGITSQDVAVNDFISPGCVFQDTYGSLFLAQMNTLGPSENTSDVIRLTRASRRPSITKDSNSFPTDIGSVQVAGVTDSRDEITNAQISYPLAGSGRKPTVPSSIDDPPNVLVLRNFGLYPL